VKWGIEHDVDYIAQSFVKNAENVKQLRKLLDENGGKEIKIIAKIEEYPAVQNIDEIIASADGIMIARGDLGVQMPIEQVPSVQKHIIEKCNEAMKPVITATQMLESMTNSPIPTRAEVTDVANAILDGSDAVMLSGETSIGKYPVKTVQMMARIIQHTEQSLLEYGQFDRHHCKVEDERNTTLSIAKAASKIATELNAAAIITYTETGRTARRIIHTRPKIPIVAVTPDEKTARKLCLCWGIIPVYAKTRAPLEEVLYKVADIVTQTGIVKKGDTVVIVTGIPLGQPGSTNLIKVQML
ncbi:MAG: pyruvate kinase, partial [Candidatus Micrarchaeota archaeon]